MVFQFSEYEFETPIIEIIYVEKTPLEQLKFVCVHFFKNCVKNFWKVLKNSAFWMKIASMFISTNMILKTGISIFFPFLSIFINRFL